MVGDGRQTNLLREKISQLQLQPFIELPGQLKDTYAAYKKIDVFLLTSDFEGLPLALMEAMSGGCVPVVSNVGGIKQLPFDGFGYKYDVFDENAIAEVMVSYLDDYSRFIEESKKARLFIVKNYSLHNQVNEVLHLYTFLATIKKLVFRSDFKQVITL